VEQINQPTVLRSSVSRFTQEDVQSLLGIDDYIVFLKFFLKPNGKISKPMTYAEFSRRAGFASRAFPRDVCLRMRSINTLTLPKFIKAMGLTGDWKEYFTLLVQKEKSDITPRELDKIKLKLIQLRARIIHCAIRKTTIKDIALADKIFSITDLPRIFASLGSLESGATLQEISMRTKIKTEELKMILAQMQGLDLVEYIEDQKIYRGKSLHLALTEIGESSFFKHYFLRSVRQLQQQSSSFFKSDEKLFLQTSLSISSVDKLKQLKNELREMIFKFAEENEDPNGTTLVDITLGMYDPSPSPSPSQ
jgi:hypothetical protein